MTLLNPHTGETVLRAQDGREHRIIFTEEAIIGIEQALDVGAIEVAQKIADGRLKLSELIVLIWAGVNAHRSRNGGGKEITTEKALAIVKACGGMTKVAGPVLEALIKCAALGLSEDDDEEADEDEPVDPTSGGASDTAPPSSPE